MHKYGIIATLPFSKHASPILAQRKPNGKLRLLVDLQKMNALISEDCFNDNPPFSTLSDAAEHLAGNKCFTNWIALRHITFYKGKIKHRLKC